MAEIDHPQPVLEDQDDRDQWAAACAAAAIDRVAALALPPASAAYRTRAQQLIRYESFDSSESLVCLPHLEVGRNAGFEWSSTEQGAALSRQLQLSLRAVRPSGSSVRRPCPVQASCSDCTTAASLQLVRTAEPKQRSDSGAPAKCLGPRPALSRSNESERGCG